MNYNNGRTSFSRFSSKEEILSSLYKIPLNENNPKYGGIPLYADSEAVYVEHLDTHTIIYGPTASKKTRFIGMASLLTYIKAGESFIATDPKAELYEKMFPSLKERDYNNVVLNLRDFEKSNCWNPLYLPYQLYHNNRADKATELVNDFASNLSLSCRSSDSYWHNSASDLLAGLILILFECAKENVINFKSLSALKIQSFGNVRNEVPFIKENFLDHLKPSTFLRALLSGTADVCDTTRGCIISVLDAILRPFLSQNKLIDTLSFNDIDMSGIGKEKTAVFLIIPDENTLYHSLISVFVKQCYTELILEAQKQLNKTLPRRVNFLLDEFASLPTIHDFPAMITASRSRNIRFNLIIQSFNQLYEGYGAEAGTIKNNCENWIILHSREKDTLEELVFLAGNKNHDELLISASTIQTLSKDEGEALLFYRRKYPFITNLLDIDSYPDFSQSNIDVQYPLNERKVESIFDFKLFCNEKNSYFLSQLFTGRTHEEILNDKEGNENFFMQNEDVILEPLFSSTKPDEKEEKKDIRIFAISDLHLSGENITKPMDIFTSYSTGYLEDVKKNWEETITDDDIVLICGDISWAIKLKDAQYDLDFISNLKGTKIMVRGNHDYWWKSITSVRTSLSNNTFALQNDSIRIGKFIFYGTRGWTIPEEQEEKSREDTKLYNRELERLKLSLDEGSRIRREGDVLICMMHYPPLNSESVDSGFLKLFNDYDVNKVVFGHLHGSHIHTPLYQVRDGIEYYLTSCDQLKNKLMRIY